VTIKCKVQCVGIQGVGADAKRAWFSVTADPGLTLDERFSMIATGMFEVVIDNPRANETLKVGTAYYLYLTSITTPAV
jgi:hypothetical protein